VARVPGLRSVVETDQGPVRRMQSGAAPACTKCGHNKRVVRLWHGKVKVWVCLDHYKVTSTRRRPATIKQRVLHKLPEAETMALNEVLPNRAARRRR
jgi:hypothetical protein